MTPAEEERAKRRDAFAIALSKGEATDTSLDLEVARSAQADELRAIGVEEDFLAQQVRRGLIDCAAGPDHLKYLRLAREWLGYRDTSAASAGMGASSALAGAVAGALAGAREAGLMAEKARTIREPMGGDAIRIIEAAREL